jgi:ligand-binding SRPBCC domain-containing protein
VKRYWHSKITKFEELNEFVDEVQNDRLLEWTHLHRFIQVDNVHTRLIDEVRVEFRFGIIGRIIEWVVLPRLKEVFSYREKKIRDILELET